MGTTLPASGSGRENKYQRAFIKIQKPHQRHRHGNMDLLPSAFTKFASFFFFVCFFSVLQTLQTWRTFVNMT